MSICRMDPLEKADIDVFVRMISCEWIACRCRSKDFELGSREHFEQLVLGVHGKYTGWRRGTN